MFAKILSHVRRQYAGFLALFIVLGGTSYAAAAGSIDSREIKNNTIRGKDIRRGAVTSSDVGNGALRGLDFRAGELPAGATGPRGATGPTGATGAPATRLFAVVNGSSGNLNYQRGATTSAKSGTGSYSVTFDRPLTGCAAVATAGTGNPSFVGDTTQTGATATVTMPTDTTVAVQTTPPGGGGPNGGPAVPVDRSFHLAVFC